MKVRIKDSRLRALISRCIELGAKLETTKNQHIKLLLPEGRMFICGTHHHSSHHLYQNIRTQLRRAWPEKAAEL